MCKVTSYGFLWALAALLSMLMVSGVPKPAAAQRVSSVVSHDVPAPRNGRIILCHGYGCFFRTPVQLSAAELQRLGAVIARGASGAETERAAIAAAIQWFEERVGPRVGISENKPRSPPSGAGDRTQLDCIDQTLNTMHLMMIFEQNGWLRHHAVDRPRSRGFFLDGRYPHSTAVLRERRSGRHWAIDPWPTEMGAPPDVMPLEVWLRSS